MCRRCRNRVCRAEAVAWFGLQAPARTPRAALDRLTAACLEICAEPATLPASANWVRPPHRSTALLDLPTRKREREMARGGAGGEYPAGVPATPPEAKPADQPIIRAEQARRNLPLGEAKRL